MNNDNETQAAKADPEAMAQHFHAVDPDGETVALIYRNEDMSLTLITAERAPDGDGLVAKFETWATWDDIKSKIGGEIVACDPEQWSKKLHGEWNFSPATAQTEGESNDPVVAPEAGPAPQEENDKPSGKTDDGGQDDGADVVDGVAPSPEEANGDAEAAPEAADDEGESKEAAGV